MHAALNVLLHVARVHTQAARGSGHKLHEPGRSGM